MSQIKIIYIVSSLLKCGPINQLYYIIKYLNKNIYDATIITLKRETDNTNILLFQKLGVQLISINSNKYILDIFYKKKVNKLLCKINPTIVQTYGFRADRIRIDDQIIRLTTLRTSLNQILPLNIKPNILGKLLGVLLYRYHLRYTNKLKNVVVCSKSLKNELRYLTAKDYMCIQNGVDVNKYLPIDKYLKNKTRKYLKLSIDNLIFITVGSLVPKKNTKLIIQTFKNNDKLKSSTLLVIGNGIEYKNLKTISEDCPNIIFVGNKKNVYDYLKVADYFISASKGEGLPNAVLEAMSVGLPCILSNIPPHEEILGEEKCATIFNQNNEDDLYVKINELLNGNYTDQSNSARSLILRSFSAQQMSNNYQKYYKQILAATNNNK